MLPPEKVGSKEQLEETKTAVLRIAAERKGCKVEELEEVYDDGQELMRFVLWDCLLYTSPSPRDRQKSRMPSSA